MGKLVRFGVSLDEDLLKPFDSLCERKDYPTRSEAIRDLIRKALVELDGKPFRFFQENRALWAQETCYVYPGAIQYFGPSEVCDITTRTLALEKA